MKKLGAFGSLELVSRMTFHTTRVGETDARLRYVNEWKKDPSVVVKEFTRNVRAGNTGDTVIVVVVRRKAAKTV